MPNKISNYVRTFKVKTITDKTASETITLFGLERKLENWSALRKSLKRKQKSRERNQLVAERTGVKNQLHAEKTEVTRQKESIESIKRIDLLDKQTEKKKLTGYW